MASHARHALIDYLAGSSKAPVAAGLFIGVVVVLTIDALAPDAFSFLGDPGLEMLVTFAPSLVAGAYFTRRWLVRLKAQADAERARSSAKIHR